MRDDEENRHLIYLANESSKSGNSSAKLFSNASDSLNFFESIYLVALTFQYVHSFI